MAYFIWKYLNRTYYFRKKFQDSFQTGNLVKNFRTNFESPNFCIKFGKNVLLTDPHLEFWIRVVSRSRIRGSFNVRIHGQFLAKLTLPTLRLELFIRILPNQVFGNCIQYSKQISNLESNLLNFAIFDIYIDLSIRNWL